MISKSIFRQNHIVLPNDPATLKLHFGTRKHLLCAVFFLVAFNTVTIAQKPYSLQAKRVRENVDMNWLFHKAT